MILFLTYNKMPPSLQFRSSLWGTWKPFIRIWVDRKVLSNLVSGNAKISTYCATHKDNISNLFLVTLKYQHTALLTKTTFQIYYELSLYLNDLQLYLFGYLTRRLFKTSISSCELLFGVSLLSICETFKAKSYSSTKYTIHDLGHW